MKISSLILILSLFSQSVSWAALPSAEVNSTVEMSQDLALESARDSAVAEIDAMIASIDTVSEAANTDAKEIRARKKLERKFNRQFKQYSRHIHSLVENNSEEELRQSFEKYTLRQGSIVSDVSGSQNGEDPLQKLVRDARPGELKEALLSLVSEESKTAMHERMNSEINQAGSARAYLKQTRTLLHSLNGCMIKSVLIYGVVYPAASLLIISGMLFGIYLAGGLYITAVGAWGTAGLVAGALGTGVVGLVTSGRFASSPAGKCGLVKRK